MSTWNLVQIFVITIAVFAVLYARVVRSDAYIDAMVVYECRYNPARIHAVQYEHDAHPCARYIDRYRWAETQGMGYFPDGGAACRVALITAYRELHCDYDGLPSIVRAVPERSDRWNGLSSREMAEALDSAGGILPGGR